MAGVVIVVSGAGPASAWLRALFEKCRAQSDVAGGPRVIVVDGPVTRELLGSLLADPVKALVLADHVPFGHDLRPDLLPSAEALRAEALRAILALELKRRAARTVVLEAHASDQWSAALGDALAELGPADAIASLPPPATQAITPVVPDLPIVSKYLAPLFASGRGTGPLTLVWPREVFLDGDVPGEVLPPTIEVAGRARFLSYGPYLPLPTGLWQATAFLGFSPEIGKMPFILEADTGGVFSRGFFETERGGLFSLTLEFTVTDPLQPVEFRLISQDSALEGQAALIELELTRLEAI